jgi:hypothetical protein
MRTAEESLDLVLAVTEEQLLLCAGALAGRLPRLEVCRAVCATALGHPVTDLETLTILFLIYTHHLATKKDAS